MKADECPHHREKCHRVPASQTGIGRDIYLCCDSRSCKFIIRLNRSVRICNCPCFKEPWIFPKAATYYGWSSETIASALRASYSE